MEMKKLKHLLIQPNDIEGKNGLAERTQTLCARAHHRCEKSF